MMAWARRKKITIISTCDVSPNNNGGSAITYCAEGTGWQKKIPYTLLNNRASFQVDSNTDLPMDILRRHRQVILHKRCTDPFEEPRIDRLLSELRANEFILIGASIEGAVKAMALGLLQRGRKVSVVIDAVGSQNKKEARLALRKMEAKGARLIETKKLAGISHLRRVGICRCEMCRRQAGKTPVKIETEY